MQLQLEELQEQLSNFYIDNKNKILLPSQQQSKYWISSYILEKNNEIVESQVDGKWMIFLDNNKKDKNNLTLHDKLYLLLLQYKKQIFQISIDDKIIQFHFKTSTNANNPNASSKKQGVTILYTSEENKFQFIENFRKHVQMRRTLYWKPDKMTEQGVYRKKGQKASTAKSEYRENGDDKDDSEVVAVVEEKKQKTLIEKLKILSLTMNRFIVINYSDTTAQQKKEELKSVYKHTEYSDDGPCVLCQQQCTKNAYPSNRFWCVTCFQEYPQILEKKVENFDEDSITVYLCDVCERNILKSDDEKKQKFLYIECSDKIFVEAPCQVNRMND